jgi:TRAP-type C4-dicarboxylate transport system substrate-binding protein
MKSLFSRIAASALIGTAAFVPQLASAQQYTMKLAASTVNDVMHEWLKTFAAGVTAASNGKIKADVYPASQLGSIPRTIEGVALGTVEVVATASGFVESIEPRFGVMAAPGLFRSYEQAGKVLGDPEVQKRLATFGSTKGFAVLSTLPATPYAVVSHKPYARLADLDGQKIRVPGSPMQLAQLKKFNALPISMPLGDVLPALQTKTIDAVWAAPNLFVAFKYYDVAKHYTFVPSSWAVGVILVNRKFLTTIGPELEKVVRDEARKADKAMVQWSLDDMGKAREAWKKNGGTEHEFSPAEAAQFNERAMAVSLPFLTGTPEQKADFDAFQAAAKGASR